MAFIGFTIPDGTNLSEKTLVIADGNYNMPDWAEPFPAFKVDGIVSSA